MAGTETDTEDEIRTVTIEKWAASRVLSMIGVALLIALTLMFLLTDNGAEILHRSVIVRTYFDDGTGLVRTADVMLDGIRVGEIKRVTLSGTSDTARAVEVQMNIQKNFLPSIPEDSRTEITADNLVGDKYINIKRGQSMSSIVAGAELKRVPPSKNFDPGDLLASVSTTLTSLSQLLDQVEDPTTPLGTLVKGEDLYAKIRDDIKAIEDAIVQNAGPKTDIGKAIYGQELYNQIRQPVLEIDRQLAAIQNGEGQYGQLLKGSAQYDDALAAIRRFRDSLHQMRTAPLIANDDQYESILATLRQLNATLDELTNGEGTTAQLLNSTQLYEQFSGASRETRVFLRDFRLNPQKYLRLKVF